MSKLLMFDFECPQDHRFESLVHSGQLDTPCPTCGEQAKRLVSIPRISLEGYTGDFPTAADAWARKHIEGTRIAEKRKYG